MQQRQTDIDEQPQSELVQCVNGILRVAKLRQQNYFRIVDFVKKNMESLGRQLEQITIVSKFLMQVDEHESALLKQEEVLIVQHSSSAANCKKYPSGYCRLVSRMSVRLVELFESSLLRIQGTIFGNPQFEEDFAHFRHSINRSMVAEHVNFNMAATLILKYSKSKYRYEVERLRRFLTKVESGKDLDFRHYYMGTEEYDSDKGYGAGERQDRDGFIRKRGNPDKKTKETSRSKDKKTVGGLRGSSEKGQSSPRHSKPATINKIMKLYSILDPSKTQFLEDMIYSESQQMHRSKLLNSLKQKNKVIEEQIKQYHKKAEFMADKLKDLTIHLNIKSFSDHEGSDRERGRSSLMKSEVNIKTNAFLLSKTNNFMIRKSKKGLLDEQIGQQTDFVINSAGQYSSGAQYASDTGAMTDRNVIRNTEVRRPVSKSLLQRKPYQNYSSRPSSKDQSKKQVQKEVVSKGSTKNRIFVVKSPVLFEDQTLQSRMVLNTGRVVNKNKQQMRTTRPVSKRMSRSVLVRDTKIQKSQKVQKVQKTQRSIVQQSIVNERKPSFKDKMIFQEKMVFDPQRFRQLGAKKEFNLRLKKHMKKNMMVSDRLFIEQTNQQINGKNF